VKRRGNLASMANPEGLKKEPVVQIYSRRNCHLCHEAESVVREVLKDISFKLEVIYIDGDQELERLYGEEVPVTLINGAKHDYFRVDKKRFSEAILRQHQ
jgi:glutaredoxin